MTIISDMKFSNSRSYSKITPAYMGLFFTFVLFKIDGAIYNSSFDKDTNVELSKNSVNNMHGKVLHKHI